MVDNRKEINCYLLIYRYFRKVEQSLEEQWEATLETLEGRFGQPLGIDGILFMIGLQELGKNYREYTKDEKLHVMHIAVCTLLSKYNYYEFVARDEEGWPHWRRNKKLPALSDKEQTVLIKRLIVDYFNC